MCSFSMYVVPPSSITCNPWLITFYHSGGRLFFMLTAGFCDLTITECMFFIASQLSYLSFFARDYIKIWMQSKSRRRGMMLLRCAKNQMMPLLYWSRGGQAKKKAENAHKVCQYSFSDNKFKMTIMMPSRYVKNYLMTLVD